MALGTNHDTTTTADKFIPELWSDDVVAPYKANLVLANLVTKVMHKGKKGDVIHIPTPARGDASAKAAETQVTLVTDTAVHTDVTIDQHWEYSRLIEDIVAIQALDSMRRFYTDDAGYALARKVDQKLFMAAENMQSGTNFTGAVIGSDGSTSWDGTANSNAGNAAALTDAGIRRMIQTLDDGDNPQSDRAIVVPPVERNNLMGIARFTEQAFTGEQAGGNTIRNGMIGDIYGVPVFVSSQCPYVHIDSADGEDVFLFSSSAMGTGAVSSQTGETVTVGTDGGVVGRVGLLLHRGAIALAEQMGVRTQTQYKQEYLGDLFTADTLFGTAELRDGGAVPFIVAN